MKIVNYKTWVKNFGWQVHPIKLGYIFCGEKWDYQLFKSVKPKDLAKFIIKSVFNDEDIEKMEFVYITHYYHGPNSLSDGIEIYCKKI